MGRRMAVAFANIFLSSVETEIISLSNTKPLEWKRYIDDYVFPLWNAEKRRYEISLPLQIDITLQLNSQLKYQTKRGGGTRDETLRVSAWVARKRAKRKRGRKNAGGLGSRARIIFAFPFYSRRPYYLTAWNRLSSPIRQKPQTVRCGRNY